MRVVSRPIPERARLITRSTGRVLVFRRGVIPAALIAYLDRLLRYV